MRRLSPAFVLNVFFVLLTAQAATAQKYTVTDLGTLGGIQSVGLDISKSGDVTGSSSVVCPGCGSTHAFLYRDGQMQDLGTLPNGSSSEGLGISVKRERGARREDLGQKNRREDIQITGESNLKSACSNQCGPIHAFLYSDGKMQDLGTLPGGISSVGYAVNRKGQVTGWADEGQNQHAFLYSNGHMRDLGTLPGGITSFGIDLNNGDSKGERNEEEGEDRQDTVQVTGFSSAADGNEHAFLYSNGTMQDLGTLPGGRYSAGRAINQSGEITGYSATPDAGIHAFLYSNGSMKDLGTLPGKSFSYGEGINRHGQIVGNARNLFDPHAFLYSHGAMQDLNNLIPSNSGWVLEFADAINDRGLITGSGNHDGQTHAFLLTPTCTQRGAHDQDCDEQNKQE